MPAKQPGRSVFGSSRVRAAFLVALIPAVLALLPAGGRAQEEPKPTPAVVPANGLSIRLEGQLQVQVATSSVDSAVALDAELRRMRLTAIGDAGRGFSGTLMLEFGTDRVRIRDAIMDYKISPRFTLRGGQFKIPFNGIETTSSKRLIMIERGARIRGLRPLQTSSFLDDNRLSARQRGFMLVFRSADERLVVQAGGWLGNGENPDNNDGKEVAGRVEYAVIQGADDVKPLVLGVAAVANGYFGDPADTLKVVPPDTLLVDDSQTASAFEGWVEYGTYLEPGLHVAGNVIAGDNPTRFHIENGDLEFESFLGVQGWAEYLLPVGEDLALAPAFRADRFDPDTETEDDANLLLTPGANLYYGKNFKAQANLDFYVPSDDTLDTESVFRFQTQVLF
jgi:hypothetical protein